MKFHNFCFNLSYYYSKYMMVFVIFIFPRLSKMPNTNYQLYFSKGYNFENFKKFMFAVKASDESTYNLFIYLPFVATLTTLICIPMLIYI